MHHAMPTHIPVTSSHNNPSPPSSHLHHQIHNPTPSYAPQNTTPTSTTSLGGNTSPPSNQSLIYTSSSTSNLLTLTDRHPVDQHNLHHLNTHHHLSPENQSPLTNGGSIHYQSGLNLPPTPNSMITIMGPNSANSNNSNEASPHPDTNQENPTTHLSAAQSISSYSPWSTNLVSAPRPQAPLSPPEIQQLNSPHHHFTTGHAPPYMQHNLPAFPHTASKNIGLPQPFYSWY